MKTPEGTRGRSIRRRGYTFVEVMVALFILGLAIGGAYQMLISAMRTRTLIHNQYNATVLANNRVERAKNLPFDSLITLRELPTAVDELGTVDVDGIYRRSTAIHTTWMGNPRVTNVEVTVQSPAPPGGTEGLEVRVTTLLTEYEQP